MRRGSRLSRRRRRGEEERRGDEERRGEERRGEEERRGGGGGGGRGRRQEEAPDIKSNNPHLAGGEKNLIFCYVFLGGETGTWENSAVERCNRTMGAASWYMGAMCRVHGCN